jgi:DNA repair protein RecO (recombination protein O)
VKDAEDPSLFDAITAAFDDIAASAPERTRDVTLGGAWRVLAELGVAPTVDVCADCHSPIARDEAVMFSHPSGGALCGRCSRLSRSGRTLPPEARAALRGWLSHEDVLLHSLQDIRAHQRLLREFLREHLADERPLRAYEVWERDEWTGGAA